MGVYCLYISRVILLFIVVVFYCLQGHDITNQCSDRSGLLARQPDV